MISVITIIKKIVNSPFYYLYTSKIKGNSLQNLLRNALLISQHRYTNTYSIIEYTKTYIKIEISNSSESNNKE